MAKILLVDDSATDRHLFASILQQGTNYVVESCSDGNAALESIAMAAPDLVLTDLRMPDMDGLELVTEMRRRFPTIPVVLLTGQGSEELATKALRAGASGYIAKSKSHDALTETVRHVLWLSKTNEVDSRVADGITMAHFELKLDNDETLIPGLLCLARQRLSELSNCDLATLLQCETALEHAVLNAIYHGNLDFKQFGETDFDEQMRLQKASFLRAKKPYCDRSIFVGIRVTNQEARFAVRDEGEGFDVQQISSLGLAHSLRGDSDGPAGRGLFLMWAFMDEVLFDNAGRSVTLVKKLGTTTSTDTKNPTQDEEKPKSVTVLRSKSGGASFDLPAARLILGREQSCDIVVEAEGVSAHHCVLFVHDGWWFVRDLDSTNGIRVDGKQCRKHLMRPNSVLTMGSASFELEYRPLEMGAVGITPPADPF